jgi:hypothetical protein
MNRYFILASAFLIIPFFISYLGNPHHGGFYFHFIPEMISFYFLGFWTYYVKYSFKFTFFIYLLTVMLTPIFVGIPLNLLYLIILPVPMMIGAPMLIAYRIATIEEMNRFE